jgi:hypothetical protein
MVCQAPCGDGSECGNNAWPMPFINGSTLFPLFGSLGVHARAPARPLQQLASSVLLRPLKLCPPCTLHSPSERAPTLLLARATLRFAMSSTRVILVNLHLLKPLALAVFSKEDKVNVSDRAIAHRVSRGEGVVSSCTCAGLQ